MKQDVNENWPLLIIDHKNKKRKMFLQAGEMLLYESATVPHGRQFPLNGRLFENIFVHFYPQQL